jgi:hypothetical protein
MLAPGADFCTCAAGPVRLVCRPGRGGRPLGATGPVLHSGRRRSDAVRASGGGTNGCRCGEMADARDLNIPILHLSQHPLARLLIATFALFLLALFHIRRFPTTPSRARDLGANSSTHSSTAPQSAVLRFCWEKCKSVARYSLFQETSASGKALPPPRMCPGLGPGLTDTPTPAFSFSLVVRPHRSAIALALATSTSASQPPFGP